MLFRLYSLCVCVALFILSSSAIHPCSTPVYQYALEHWTADPYEAFVFQQKPLSPEEQAKLNILKRSSQDEKFSANILVKNVDLSDSQSPELRKLWELQGKPNLPYMIIKYPRFSKIPEEVWGGNFKDVNVESIIDSPARKEIAKRILDGEVAVWVFLESGNNQQDKATLQLLETQLNKMSETLKIKIISDATGQIAETDGKVRFSTLKLSRNDKNESFFLKMLINSEADLKTITRPMVFPIFGKGRCLYALVGEGINADNIESVCSFLVGWCSCEVKDMNPGVDLLMSVNWNRALYEDIYDETQADNKISDIALSTTGNSDKSEKMVANSSDDKKKLLRIQNKSLNTNELGRNEINKEIKKITANSEKINTMGIVDEPSNMVRNLVITALAIFLGVTAVVSLMVWRRIQRS